MYLEMDMSLKCLMVLSLLWPVLAQSPKLRRSLEKSGFHRDLSADIYLHKHLLDVRETEDIVCYLLFTESIPSGAYVDPYQIASLRPFGGPDALIRDKVDIEKPEYLSQPLTVEIFTRLHNTGEFWSSNYTLPVHLRYHAISDTEDFGAVTFKIPEVALRCSNFETGLQYHSYMGPTADEKRAACDSKNQLLCDWTVLETSIDCDDQLILSEDLKSTPCQQDSIIVKVPVGRSSDYYLVMGGTLLFTVGGCIILGVYVVNKDKDLKMKAQ